MMKYLTYHPINTYFKCTFYIPSVLQNINLSIMQQAQLRLCKLGLGTLFKGAIKSSIFVVQKAAAPKNGVEFRQIPIGDIRCNLAMSHDVW